jgi:hypothetical protein
MTKESTLGLNAEFYRRFGPGGPLRLLTLASVTVALSLFVTLSPCHLVTLSPCQGAEGDEVPVFRRLLLSPQRLPEELKRVQDGVLVRLPVTEFDALVQRAHRSRVRKIAPHLLEARYHATLKDESLIGEGQWKLVHAGPGPGLLKVQPLNLALRQARFENGDALIAAFDGKTPALLVDTPGERTVSLDWSARAESGPEGLQFHLEMPACPIALLELDVPAGRTVTVLNDGALASGPHEAEDLALRRWRIGCAGGQRMDRQRVDIRIHPADRPTTVADPSPAPFVHQKTIQKVSPEGLDATFELTLNSMSCGFRELVCECDSELRLRDVVGPGVEGCSLRAGDGNKPSRLTIRLREPVRVGTWQIHCLAPPNHSPTSGDRRSIAWRSPGLRLVNGVPRGETLMLWFHADFRVEGWDPGSFRLSSADVDRSNGSQVLTLLGGGIGPARRPAARLQAYGVEFSTQQLTWWRCNASGMALTAQIGWDVTQGHLYQLQVRLPADWEVEKVEMSPAPLLRDWHFRKAEGSTTLFVDLTNTLPLGLPQHGKSENRNPKAEIGSSVSDSPRKLPTLTVHMRPSASGMIGKKHLPFPDPVPLGARYREGALALDCDEQVYRLEVNTTAERTEPESEGPWGQQLPLYYYRYRGQPLTGEIAVRSRPPRLRAKCDSEVLVAGSEAAIETHLMLEADAGSPNTIELWLSAGDGGAWQWRTEASPRAEESNVNRIRRIERVYNNETSYVLHLLAASHPLRAAVVGAARPPGERWRLTLTRPLRLREPLRLYAQHRLQPRNNRWDVPLPVVLGAERMEGEVVLHLDGAGLIPVRSVGLQESASIAEQGATPWRAFRYGQNEVSLSLTGVARGLVRSPVASIEQASLITYVSEKGVLQHSFSFQVTNWGEHSLPLRLPPGSQPLAMQVDGRWLSQLHPSSHIHKLNEEEGQVELALPVPTHLIPVSGDSSHYFEVVYRRDLPASMLWQSIDDPSPQLPVAPLAFRRLWRLHPKLVPLRQGRYQFVPGTLGKVELAALPRHVADLFHLPGSWGQWDPLQEDRQMDAGGALRQAVQQLRNQHADQRMSLAEIVSATSLLIPRRRFGGPRFPIIIDEFALREAGVRAKTRFTIKRPSPDEATPPWQEYGLTAVPTRSAILLTTTSGRGALLRQPVSEKVENALVEAAQRGQDASGRFRSAISWLNPESVDDLAGSIPSPLDIGYEGSDWSEWETIAGSADDRLIVVRRDSVTALGLALALMTVLSFWLPQFPSSRRRLAFLLLALTISGLGMLWLPASLRDLAWWPFLASGAVAALAYLGPLVRKSASPQSQSPRQRNAPTASVVAGMLLLSLSGWSGRADAPAPATVYLVPASAYAPDKQTVLVPADLLDRFKVLAQPAPLTPGGPQTVLLDASYEGRLVDEGKQAEFVAVFSAHSLGDGPSNLIVPLAGVQLVGEVLLDGARVAPLAAPQAGYSFSVRGRGRHKIELHIRVPVVGTKEDRNVMFTAPPLLRSRLVCRLPAGAVDPHVLVKNGAEWSIADGDGQRLEADLGALPLPVHLHWYQPNGSTRVSYQAAYVWTLGMESSHLAAWLRYRVEQGAVKTLLVDLPSDLEVASAIAQRTPTVSRPSWSTRFQLYDWHVTRSGRRRVLHLEFPFPISGDFQVTLELLPHSPLTSPAALLLPWPRGIPAAGPHYLAYRKQPGLSAQRDTSQNLTRIGNKEFAPDWPGGPSLGSDFQGIAYRISPTRPPQLLLRFEAKPPSVQAEIDVSVQAGLHRAEIDVIADIVAPDKDLIKIEWELPPHCFVSSVAGEGIRTWKQDASRVLVWLNRTATRARIHLNGWSQLSLRDGSPHLALSGPRLVNVEKQHTRLRMVTSGDCVLAALQTQNLQPVKSESSASSRHPQSVEANPLPESEGTTATVFETWGMSYRLECQLQAAVNAVARVLTAAEVTDRELRFTTTVDYTVTKGELRMVRMRLRNWQEEKVELHAERVALRSGPRLSRGERSWKLPLQAGIRGHYQVILRGSIPLDKTAGGVPMPEVLVQGVERADYYLAVIGSDLSGRAKGPLQSLKTDIPDPKLDSKISELVKRGERVWHVDGPEWQMLLSAQMRERILTPVRIYLMEHWAAAADGQHWLHEARCWLSHEAHANLTLDFAAPVRVLSASLDAHEATPPSEIRTRKTAPDKSVWDFGFRSSDANKRVWLPLPAQPGIRCVRLRWMYDSPEPLDRPNLTAATVAGAAPTPVLWTVVVPRGWQAPLDGLSGRNESVREAEQALWRAEAQLRICRDLIKERQDNVISATLAVAQQRFEQYCHHARRAIDLDADVGNFVGPQGQGLSSLLEDLEANNRLFKSEIRNPKTEVPLSDSAIGIRGSDFEAGGGPLVSWRALPGEEPLVLQLTSCEKYEIRRALISSSKLLGVLVAVWLLSVLPSFRTRLYLFWPEQIALIGILGWHLAGLTTIVLGLLFLAAVSRIFLVTRALRVLLRKRRRQPSTMTADNGALP